jgi:hypothetical protein
LNVNWLVLRVWWRVIYRYYGRRRLSVVLIYPLKSKHKQFALYVYIYNSLNMTNDKFTIVS